MFPRRSVAPQIGPGHRHAAEGFITHDRARRTTMTMKDYVDFSENSGADFRKEPVSRTTNFNDTRPRLMSDAARRNGNQRVDHDQSAEIDVSQLRQFSDSTGLEGPDASTFASDDHDSFYGSSTTTAGFVPKDDANQSIHSKKPCSSLLSLLQQERIECGKSSPWTPLSRLDKRSKSERKANSKETTPIDVVRLQPDDYAKRIQICRSISDSSLMMNRHSPSDANRQHNYDDNYGVRPGEGPRTIGQNINYNDEEKDLSDSQRNPPVVSVDGRNPVDGSDSESSCEVQLQDYAILCEESIISGGRNRCKAAEEKEMRGRRRRRLRRTSSEMPAAVRRTSSVVAKVGVPVAMMSERPYTDIFRSLYEMGRHIMEEAAAEAEKGRREEAGGAAEEAAEVAAELEELLVCYLALNSPSLATLIRHAFAHAISHLLLL